MTIADHLQNKFRLNHTIRLTVNKITLGLCFGVLLCGGVAVISVSQSMAQDNPFERALNPSPNNGSAGSVQSNVSGGNQILPSLSGSQPNPQLNPQPSPQTNPGFALPTDTGLSARGGNVGVVAPPSPAQLEAVEKAKARDQERIREEAFNAAINGLLPLNPDEIREVLKKYDEAREAIETPYYEHPKPTVSILPVSLDPSALPPELKLATGHVSTVSILDTTGEPWPIEDISWAGDFQFVEAQNGGNLVRITPLSEYAYGNISMRLVGLVTPITITLRTQRDEVQYRVDIRVPQRGPNARIPLIEQNSSLQAGDDLVSAILDGSPPGDIERLDVSGVDGRTRAYRANGLVYLRTPLTLLSPGWISSARSGDGTSVFVLNDTPLVLLSDQGRMQRVKLKENRDEEFL